MERLKAEIAALKPKLDRINNAFAEGVIEMAGYKEMKNPLIPQKVSIEQQLIAEAKGKTNRIELLKRWIFEAK